MYREFTMSGLGVYLILSLMIYVQPGSAKPLSEDAIRSPDESNLKKRSTGIAIDDMVMLKKKSSTEEKERIIDNDILELKKRSAESEDAIRSPSESDLKKRSAGIVVEEIIMLKKKRPTEIVTEDIILKKKRSAENKGFILEDDVPNFKK